MNRYEVAKAYLAAKWQQLAEWAAWSAWNYARKRAIRHEAWLPADAQQARADQSPEQRRIVANDANGVLENKHFTAAWDALHFHLEAQAERCDPDNKDMAQRIVIAKQLLRGLKREFERKLSDGYMAEAELEELERRKRTVRFIR